MLHDGDANPLFSTGSCLGDKSQFTGSVCFQMSGVWESFDRIKNLVEVVWLVEEVIKSGTGLTLSESIRTYEEKHSQVGVTRRRREGGHRSHPRQASSSGYLPWLTCFGSDHHRFRFSRPIWEVAVRSFERRPGIRLPGDYRAFLRLAGNGGGHYGLVPLEKWNDAVLEVRTGYLAMPSPLGPAYRTESHASRPGQFRWRAVYVNLDCCGTPYFVHHPDFLSRYERWLDELLWGYDGSWFGFGLPGCESDLVRVLREDGSGDQRSEALSTLTRLASLRSETLELLRALLGDVSAGVRAQACHLLGKRGVAAASAEIAAWFQADDQAVRKAAD